MPSGAAIAAVHPFGRAATNPHTGPPFRSSPSFPVPRVSFDLAAGPSSLSRWAKGTMAKEICISSTPHETRLAILEDDQLAEIYYERENEYTLAGSIYNGRVTRVLPGMQSAFVDIGLERDAFLYVTDFLELEDQEESDEIEKASSSPQAPREVRHSGGERERGGRNGRGERQPREAKPAVEAEPAETEYILPSSSPVSASALAETPESAEEGSDEPGAKRWRGRRRRRGGRGGAGAPEASNETEETAEIAAPAKRESVAPDAHEIQAAATRAPRGGDRTPAPFVLPGESLTKYGGTPVEDEPKAKPAAAARPASTAKPSTMVEAPLEWDGSGLLPGESISRHRNRASEPEPETEIEAAPQTHEALRVDEELVEEELTREGLISDEEATGEEEVVKESATSLAEADPEVEVVHETEFEANGEEPENDASASHHVDPLPPSSFRLFGFGGKKNKDEDEPHEEAEVPAREVRPASVSTVSAFSPGNGLVEEELIDGEELDVPLHRHAHKHDEGDLDEYEEETLQTQIRSGELGEMLQEAHLDHRIQLDFDDKSSEGEDEDEVEGEEEETVAEGQPAGEGQTQQRRERGGRGRRGRGGERGGERSGERGGERGGRPGDRRPSRRSAQTSDLPIISDLLKPGQEILVQIAKEPIAKKGARITSHIALPGRSSYSCRR